MRAVTRKKPAAEPSVWTPLVMCLAVAIIVAFVTLHFWPPTV